MSFFFLSTLIVYNLIKDMYNAEREAYYNFHAYLIAVISCFRCISIRRKEIRPGKRINVFQVSFFIHDGLPNVYLSHTG